MNPPSDPVRPRFFPPAQWLAAYRSEWLRSGAIASITLAAHAIPVSLAYAALADLPPQIGVYLRLVACDLSASPYVDLAGAGMLHDLHDELASRKVTFCNVAAHAQLRALLRAEGLADRTDSSQRLRSLDSLLADDQARSGQRTA